MNEKIFSERLEELKQKYNFIYDFFDERGYWDFEPDECIGVLNSVAIDEHTECKDCDQELDLTKTCIANIPNIVDDIFSELDYRDWPGSIEDLLSAAKKQVLDGDRICEAPCDCIDKICEINRCLIGEMARIALVVIEKE